MTLTEILPNARLLPAADKLRLIRLLLVEIDDGDDVSPLEHGRTYAVPTPQFEAGAAAALQSIVANVRAEIAGTISAPVSLAQ